MRSDGPSGPVFAAPIEEIRCPDCELNGFLDNIGRPFKKARYTQCRDCSECGGFGRLHLVTKQRIDQDPHISRKMGRKAGYRIVSHKETLDPYMLDVPRNASTSSQEPFSAPSSRKTTQISDSVSPGGRKPLKP